MKKISRSENNLIIIIENMNDILSKTPQVVDDVYIDDGNINIYLKKRIIGIFGAKTAYDFAVLTTERPIINVISFINHGSDGYTVRVSDVNTKEILYEISLYEGDKYHKEVIDIYDKLEYLYIKDAEVNAMNVINDIFNTK
jgi:hypothetical protein